jgi:hypothetical protein
MVPIFQFTPIPFWRQRSEPGLPEDGEPLNEAEVAWWGSMMAAYRRKRV